MITWPLLHRNKVEDSKVLMPVSSYAESDDEAVKTLAQKVGFSHPVLCLLTINMAIAASGPLGHLGDCLPYTEKNENGALTLDS